MLSLPGAEHFRSFSNVNSGVHKTIMSIRLMRYGNTNMMAQYKLYTYFRSSCAARVRIAAHYKGIDLKYHFIHLLKNEHLDSQYVAKLNPSKSVPTLVVQREGKEVVIRQSIAILEYLEETHPEAPRLLPTDPAERATIRDLVNIVACDVQPVTNMRVSTKVKAMGADVQAWQQANMSAGLAAFEAIARSTAGKYCFGDEVSLADVVLGPAVDGAIRFGVDMEQFPTIMRVYQQAQQLDAFKRGGWKAQPDTPEEFRG